MTDEEEPIHIANPGHEEVPENIEAEQAVLGTLMVWNNLYDELADALQPHHFSDTVLGAIYNECTRRINRGQTANPVTLAGVDPTWTAQLLSNVANSATTKGNAVEYARIIVDLALRRRLMRLSTAFRISARDLDGKTAREVLDEIEVGAFQLANEEEEIDGPLHIEHYVATALEEADKAYKEERGSALSSGLADLDGIIGGCYPGDLLIVAGRPSMGKTALALSVALQVAQEGTSVLIFSLEMAGEQLSLRELAAKAGTSVQNIRQGKMETSTFEAMHQGGVELRELPIYIDDRAALDISTIHNVVRRMVRRHKIGLVMVDYIQLASAKASRRDGRVQEISEITRGLKAIAKSNNVPVVALSQLSRAVEARDDRRPILSDLRESGSIEQDADVVVFIYREQYYLERARPVQKDTQTDDKFAERMARWEKKMVDAANIATLIVAKQRQGPTGSVSVRFDTETTRFTNFKRST